MTTPGASAVQRLLDELCVLERAENTDLPLVPRPWRSPGVVSSL
ncbi:hypothetical protein [Kibdelosporangium philippinense]